MTIAITLSVVKSVSCFKMLVKGPETTMCPLLSSFTVKSFNTPAVAFRSEPRPQRHHVETL